MKKKQVMFLAVVSIIWVACNNKDQEAKTNPGSSSTSTTDTIPNSPCGLNEKDLNFITGWNRFKNDPKPLEFASAKDIPVPYTIADKCIREYLIRFGTVSPDTKDVKFTQRVLFATDAFKKWINDFDVFNKSNALIMEFGIYTREVYDDLERDGNPETSIKEDAIGKITLFVSPYSGLTRSVGSDGSVINPFNLGSLHP